MPEQDVKYLVALISTREDCAVFPQSGLPQIENGHVLPDDLRSFYELCGGAELFSESPFPITVVSPDKLKVHNSEFFGMNDRETVQVYREHYGDSWSWYTLASYENSNFFTIDLDPNRLGRCYNSDHELHPADSYIVATSFTDFLQRLLSNPTAPMEGGETELENLGSALS